MVQFSKNNVIVLAVLLVIVCSVGFTTYWVILKNTDLHGGKPTVADQLQSDGILPFTDLDNLPFDLSQYEGKTIIINTWATWTPFSIQELKDFEIFAEEQSDDVIIIAINRSETPERVKGYMLKYLGDPQAIVFLLDPKDAYYKSIEGFSMPETVFYNPDGSVFSHKHGSLTLNEMRTTLSKMRETSE